MVKKKWGRVVHISSNSVENSGNQWQPHGGSAPYSASKSYLNQYIKNNLFNLNSINKKISSDVIDNLKKLKFLCIIRTYAFFYKNYALYWILAYCTFCC